MGFGHIMDLLIQIAFLSKVLYLMKDLETLLTQKLQERTVTLAVILFRLPHQEKNLGLTLMKAMLVYLEHHIVQKYMRIGES